MSSNEKLDGSMGELNLDGSERRICKTTDSMNASGLRRHGGYNTNDQEKKLRSLLGKATDIESLEHFTYWKDEFLLEYKDCCDPEGTATAREVEQELYTENEHLAKLALKVKELCKSGGITETRSSVKGQNALNELVAMMASTETHIRNFMPKTAADEEKAGYTKFELAAVLIRDGFRIYSIMVSTRDYIISLCEPPNGPLSKGNILKPNSRSIMEFYIKSIDSLCDTFADMGLWSLMEKCEEIYSVRPRKKKKKPYVRGSGKDPLSDTSEEDSTPQKGRLFQRPKKKYNRAVMDQGWTSGVTGQGTKPTVGSKKPNGELWTEEDIEEFMKNKKKGKSSTGKVKGDESKGDDDDDDDDKDIDYIYYYDPVSKVVGKIPRESCLKAKIAVWKDEESKSDQQTQYEGKVDKWDGQDGIKNIIWTFKEGLKDKPKQTATKGKKKK